MKKVVIAVAIFAASISAKAQSFVFAIQGEEIVIAKTEETTNKIKPVERIHYTKNLPLYKAVRKMEFITCFGESMNIESFRRAEAEAQKIYKSL